MDNELKKKHRDLQRSNGANAAIQGCIYADINMKCIDTLIDNSNNKELEGRLSNAQVTDILEIAKDSGKQAKRLLVKAQSSISKRNCTDYAHQQLSQLNSMHKNNEKLDNVHSVSSYIISKDLMNITKSLVSNDPKGTYNELHIV